MLKNIFSSWTWFWCLVCMYIVLRNIKWKRGQKKQTNIDWTGHWKEFRRIGRLQTVQPPRSRWDPPNFAWKSRICKWDRKNPNFDITLLWYFQVNSFENYTKTHNRVYLTHTDIQKTLKTIQNIKISSICTGSHAKKISRKMTINLAHILKTKIFLSEH